MATEMDYFQIIPQELKDKIFSDYETWRFDSSFPFRKKLKIISYSGLLEKTDITPDNKDVYSMLSWHTHSNYLSVLQIQQFSDEMGNTVISFCNKIAIIIAQHFMKNVCQLKGIKFNHPNPKS